MLNKLLSFVRQYEMLQKGDTLICAVSGGADSMALLWAMYLLKDKLGITLEAAHFNHKLRAGESDRDEAFVKNFCTGHGIVCHCAAAQIIPGSKGLEAAARDVRYRFFQSLSGKIATAHTADDNAETLLMHLIRGTGLRGLGAIAPVNGPLIRPMLLITRKEVLAFLSEYSVSYVDDSSNKTDAFLRNRLRHHVMPLLTQENPKIAQNLSQTALRLRLDEQMLSALTPDADVLDVNTLKQLPDAAQARILAAFLERNGVKEPGAGHIALAKSLAVSDKPSASASFGHGITLSRNYDLLQPAATQPSITPVILPCPGVLELPQIKLRIICAAAQTVCNDAHCFAVKPQGNIVVRCRQSGDLLHFGFGSKSLKKLFIDRKIPARQRLSIPVIADDLGILGVYGIGADHTRKADSLPAMQIRFEQL